jgi:hypothetical protein
VNADYKAIYHVFFEDPGNPASMLGAYGVSWPKRLDWFREYVIKGAQSNKIRVARKWYQFWNIRGT